MTYTLIHTKHTSRVKIHNLLLLHFLNFHFISLVNNHLVNNHLVISQILHLTLDPFLRFEDAVDWHVHVQTARTLHLALIPLLGALTFLLHRLPLHAHRQALLVPAVLTAVSLPLVDDAGLLLATGIRQILTHGPLEESLATLATERRVHFKRITTT